MDEIRIHEDGTIIVITDGQVVRLKRLPPLAIPDLESGTLTMNFLRDLLGDA